MNWTYFFFKYNEQHKFLEVLNELNKIGHNEILVEAPFFK